VYRDKVPDPAQVEEVKVKVQTDLVELFPAIFPDLEATGRAIGETIHFVSGKPALLKQLRGEPVPADFEVMRTKLVQHLHNLQLTRCRSSGRDPTQRPACRTRSRCL